MDIKLDSVKYFEMYMKRTTVYSKLAYANLLAAVEKTLSETQGLIDSVPRTVKHRNLTEAKPSTLGEEKMGN